MWRAKIVTNRTPPWSGGFWICPQNFFTMTVNKMARENAGDLLQKSVYDEISLC
jgi:hypothetical protein